MRWSSWLSVCRRRRLIAILKVRSEGTEAPNALVDVRVEVVEVKVDVDHALQQSAASQCGVVLATHNVRPITLISLVISRSGLALRTRSDGHSSELGVGHLGFRGSVVDSEVIAIGGLNFLGFQDLASRDGDDRDLHLRGVIECAPTTAAVGLNYYLFGLVLSLQSSKLDGQDVLTVGAQDTIHS